MRPLKFNLPQELVQDGSELRLHVQYAYPKSGLPTRAQFKCFVRAALQQTAEITLRIVDALEAQQLNQQYRGKNYVPNVLSFPLTNEPYLLGDIVLCASVIATEALAQGKPLLAHYAHLTIHGVLHLQGYDHQNDDEAGLMEALESTILQKLGYPSPYLHY
ncbi:MAG: rRNA maturation RNase YbeY [Methylophilaceae bacterium]|nr:rRNA maturation RNase YbeY [Methylophilaceae bacterium]